MVRRVAVVIYAVLAAVFAFAALYLLPYVISGRRLLGYCLVLVFALGSVVAVRLARESFRTPAHERSST